MRSAKSTAKRTEASTADDRAAGGSASEGVSSGVATAEKRQRLRRPNVKGNSATSTEQVASLIKPAAHKRADQLPTPQAVGKQIEHALVAHHWRPGRSISFFVTVDKRGSVVIHPSSSKNAASAPQPSLESALDCARQRGKALAGAILSQDDMLNAEAFGALVGTTRETINSWRRNHRVLGLAGAKRGFRFPAWQLDRNGKPFEALPALFARFGGGPWQVYRFLIQPHAELDGMTGLEALRAGKEDDVLCAAESITRGTFS